jgi:hypothetical protein
MRKSRLILGALVCCISFAFIINPTRFIDTYKVIKVNGLIVYKKSSKNMLQGDEFSENEELVFKTADSKAAVISVQKGRFILAPGTDKNKYAAKSNLLPASSNVSSRDGAVLNLLDLQNLFTGNLVVLNKTKVFVGKETFPMNDKCFFYLRYKYGTEEINKKLSFEGDKIIFDRSEILSVDGKPVNMDKIDCKLYYLNDLKNSSLVNEFTLALPENETMKAEIGILLQEVSNKQYGQKIDEVMAYLKDFYGKSRKPNVMEWMKEYMNITE